ncbi:FAD-dependent oxidoreductase [Tichowtungia aerotolerans]|uniref:FAD-dependent oxidoreductase n=1 Tax=Tichowtungia aerotolerans TaxID=2697043 RepID=A0A6P1M0R1_9BACT|nr:FAD-dependent oxidoreductase [Tichowtungia aerotolerans]QHI68379.1 FAD-dependent oxidoreductase [Tichowtungia aerotolerans]
MIKESFVLSRRLKTEILRTDLCVAGGGLAGVCAAITAARAGIRVVLVQDRPVLGGNASSEVRLWTLGATSHMGNNNRWAREGGLINELLTENLYRNPEGNALLFDALLFEKATAESNLTLLLNTAVFDASKSADDRIESVKAFNSQNSTHYEIFAPLFLDASGDGILGFLSGAAFRIGQEARDEFGELYAPENPSSDLLGHTVYFTSKDTGQPVKFIPPANALDMDEVRKIRRYRGFDSTSQACNFWWLEYGGHLDTVHQSEDIKQELWRVVYGVWNYIKNSGKFPDAETMTLEWVGTVPGKRESRRFEGETMMIQQDIIEQREHPDAVSFGGWAIDHHPVGGLYSKDSGCTQWHSKGVFQIPYRALYSRNIENLFLGGRLISASHIAFGSTRVMATCAHTGQATGIAAAQCIRDGLNPRDLLEPARMEALQQELLREGQYIPGKKFQWLETPRVSASSTCVVDRFAPDGPKQKLTHAQAVMLPVQPGSLPEITYRLDVAESTTLRAELRVSSRPDNHTPNVTLETIELSLDAGNEQSVILNFKKKIETKCYAFVCLMPNPAVSVQLSKERRTGILTVYQKFDEKVAKTPAQTPPGNSGIDSFEFWIPQRRPDGQNPAIELNPPLECFAPKNVSNGWNRPVRQVNAWVADPADSAPVLTLEWDAPQTISRIDLFFDGDYDHPMETVLWGHPEREVPFCVKQYRVLDGDGNVQAEVQDNHQAQNTIRLESPVITDRLRLENLQTGTPVPPAIFEVRCY